MTPLQHLLSSLVDYAGLFPPAQLSLPDAMTLYDRARSAPYAWMLDRFVIPASRLLELVQHLPSVSDATQVWSLSVILSSQWRKEWEQIEQMSHCLAQDSPVQISALEVAPLPPEEIAQVCLQAPIATTFFEIPFELDLAPYLDVLHQTGASAKLRTGGVTPEAFPDSRQLAQRILSLAEARIPFKATAGLHHPLRGKAPLTGESDSPFTTMHGFLNVALLAAFAYHQPLTLDAAVSLLEETSIAAFTFNNTEVHWGGYMLSSPDIERSRQQCFRSLGSCSMQEPIADLQELGLLLLPD